MKRFAPLLILFFVVSSSYAWNVPDGFQEFRWGMSFDEVTNLRPYKLKPLRAEGNLQMWVDESPRPIGEIPLKYITMRFLENRLVGLMLAFDPSHWETLRDAMIARYGKPTTRDTSIVQNQMGASFEKESLAWLSNKLDVAAISRCDRVDTGCITFMTERLRAELKRRQHQKEKKAIEGF